MGHLLFTVSTFSIMARSRQKFKFKFKFHISNHRDEY